MLKFFAKKMWVAFAVQKLLTFFQQKNIRILYIESAKTVNKMTLNELVKLTTLWTTGPWFLQIPSERSKQGKTLQFLVTSNIFGLKSSDSRAFSEKSREKQEK